jgi:hypothetical protein
LFYRNLGIPVHDTSSAPIKVGEICLWINGTDTSAYAGIRTVAGGAKWMKIGKSYLAGYGLNLSGLTFAVDTLFKIVSNQRLLKTLDSLKGIIPTIYNSDGTITANRLVNAGLNHLWFEGDSTGIDLNARSVNIFSALKVNGQARTGYIDVGLDTKIQNDSAIRLLSSRIFAPQITFGNNNSFLSTDGAGRLYYSDSLIQNFQQHYTIHQLNAGVSGGSANFYYSGGLAVDFTALGTAGNKGVYNFNAFRNYLNTSFTTTDTTQGYLLTEADSLYFHTRLEASANNSSQGYLNIEGDGTTDNLIIGFNPIKDSISTNSTKFTLSNSGTLITTPLLGVENAVEFYVYDHSLPNGGSGIFDFYKISDGYTTNLELRDSTTHGNRSFFNISASQTTGSFAYFDVRNPDFNTFSFVYPDSVLLLTKDRGGSPVDLNFITRNLPSSSDTTNNKPDAVDQYGKHYRMNYWPGGGGSGTVTSVATGYGLLGGPITTTGTAKVDSSLITTRLWHKKSIDSLGALTLEVLAPLNIHSGSPDSLDIDTSYVNGVATLKTLVKVRDSLAALIGGGFTLPSFTAGSIPVADGTTLVEDNSHFFYDVTNHRLGIGLTSPARDLSIHGSGDNTFLRMGYDNATYFADQQYNATNHGDFIFNVNGNSQSLQHFYWRFNNNDVASLSGGGVFNIAALSGTGNGLSYHNSAGDFLRSSIDPAKLVYSLNTNSTDVGNVTTGEDDLMTYSVPGATLATNGDKIEGVAYFNTATNANSKTIKLYFGSSSVSYTGVTSAGGVIECRFQIIRTGATTQKITYTFIPTNGTILTAVSTAGETLSGAITLKFTGDATATDDIVQKSMALKYVPN